MNPASVINSFTGVVAVVMVFAIPLMAIIATLAIVFAAINRRHRERMKMIEQGMMPAPPKKRTGNYYALLITGAVLLAFGLGLFVAALASDAGDFEAGLIFGFVGLGLLASFVIIRIMRRKERQAQNDVPQENPIGPPDQL